MRNLIHFNQGFNGALLNSVNRTICHIKFFCNSDYVPSLQKAHL